MSQQYADTRVALL